jgi:hypothetical protein
MFAEHAYGAFRQFIRAIGSSGVPGQMAGDPQGVALPQVVTAASVRVDNRLDRRYGDIQGSASLAGFGLSLKELSALEFIQARAA